MAGTEFLFFGRDGEPSGDGTDLLDGVAFFAAVVFAIGEGVVFGRDAVRKFEVAIGLFGRVDGAPGFVE